MSGHSKWSKVKHQKESTDAVKGKIFTKLASSIIIAVKEGGGIADPNSNFRLRLAIEKARSANMPKENIQRAIEKGKGHGGEGNMEKAIYEAFGPGGVGIIILAATDNHQRTTAEIKNILDRGGGVLAAQGSVSYLFQFVGFIQVTNNKNFDEMMSLAIDAGANDLIKGDGYYAIFTNPADLHKVKENLATKGLLIDLSELIYRPNTYTKVTTIQKEKIENLVLVLNDSGDVQKVYTNMDKMI